MATHPYISGAGNITQMIGFLRKNFPQTVTSETVKKYGLASNNESYVINVLQFLGLVDEEGKRTQRGHDVMTTHDEDSFQEKFGGLVKSAYAELFEMYGDDAWELPRDKLIGYFRSADKTSEVIGGRQSGVFVALRELAGHKSEQSSSPAKPKSTASAKAKVPAAATASGKGKSGPKGTGEASPAKAKPDMALTVRIEINLPTEGTQETYDAIFKSIKANLLP